MMQHYSTRPRILIKNKKTSYRGKIAFISKLYVDGGYNGWCRQNRELVTS